MTQNQLKYQELQLKGKELEEAKTHNRAQESYWGGSLNETHRHDVVGEQIDLSKIMETARHNQAVEGYESLLSGARTRLANQQSNTEYQKTRLSKIEADYGEARQITGLVESGTKSFKNITGGVGEIIGIITGLG